MRDFPSRRMGLELRSLMCHVRCPHRQVVPRPFMPLPLHMSHTVIFFLTVSSRCAYSVVSLGFTASKRGRVLYGLPLE